MIKLESFQFYSSPSSSHLLFPLQAMKTPKGYALYQWLMQKEFFSTGLLIMASMSQEPPRGVIKFS